MDRNVRFMAFSTVERLSADEAVKTLLPICDSALLPLTSFCICTCRPKSSFTVSKNETPAAFVPITVNDKKVRPIAATIANLAAVNRNDLWLVNITMNSSELFRKLLETRTAVAPLGNPGRNYTYI